MKNFYTINPKRCRGRLYTRSGRFRTFPFSDARWSFTRASNYRALTEKNLVFWMVVAYGRYKGLQAVAGGTTIHSGFSFFGRLREVVAHGAIDLKIKV